MSGICFWNWTNSNSHTSPILVGKTLPTKSYFKSKDSNSKPFIKDEDVFTRKNLTHPVFIPNHVNLL